MQSKHYPMFDAIYTLTDPSNKIESDTGDIKKNIM